MSNHTFVPIASVKRLLSRTVWINTHDIMDKLGHIPSYFGIFGRPVESRYGLLVKGKWDVRLVRYIEYVFVDTSGSGSDTDEYDSDDGLSAKLGPVRVFQGEANYYFSNMIDILRYHGYIKNDNFGEPEVVTGYQSLVNRIVWVNTRAMLSELDETQPFVHTYGRSISFEQGTLTKARWNSRMVGLLEAGFIYVNLCSFDD